MTAILNRFISATLLLIALFAMASEGRATTNIFNFTPTTVAANTGPVSPASGAATITGASLTAGDVIVLDCLVINVNGTQSDNWGGVELNSGSFLGLTGATLGVLARTGNLTPCSLYVNGVANNFVGSTSAVTNHVRIELYVTTTGSTAKLGYRASIDVGATGTAATTYSLTGTNLTFAGNSINLTFGANTVTEAFIQNTPVKTFSFGATTVSANGDTVNPSGGVNYVSGGTLAAGDTVVLDCFVVNVNGTQNDNWGAVELNPGGFLGITGATLGILTRTGTSTPSALYVNGVANNFVGSTAAVTNRVRIELYIATTGSTTNLGYRALVDVGATGTAATTYTLTGTNLTFAGNTIRLTFGANGVSEAFIQNPALSAVLVTPANPTVLTNLSAIFTATISNSPYLIRTTQQWRKNGVFIPNATNLVYTTPPVVAGDSGSIFDVVVTNRFLTTNVVTSSATTLSVRTNGVGTVTIAFPPTTVGAGVGPVNPSNGPVSIGGLQLQAGDTVVFDGTIINPASLTGDNWGAVNFNSGGLFGVVGAKLGVLARTGTAPPNTCDLYVNAAGPTHFIGTSELNTNRVVISLFVSQTGSTTNMGYRVQIAQNLSGTFNSTLSGTNLTFSGNAINLSFTAYGANEQFLPNLPFTGLHLVLPDQLMLAGAAEQSAVRVDNASVSNVPPIYNPGFTYSSSDTSVVTVSASGLLQAVGPGTATVTLASGALTDIQTVNVTNVSGNLLAVRLAVSSQMLLGNSQQAVVRGDFANVADVDLLSYGQPTFTVANSNQLVVSSSGLVTAIGPGKDSLAASYGGLSSSFQPVTVNYPTNRFIFDSFGDGFWVITNAANGNVLTVNVSGAGQAPYTNGATGQQFELLYNLQNSTFRIRQHSTWQCIGPLSGNPSIGTAVVTLPNYTGGAAQQWYFVDVGNGNFRIVNAASSLALQTDNGSPARVTMAAVSTNAVQLWNFSYQTHYPKKGAAGYEGSYAQYGLNWAYNYNDNTSASLPPSVNYVPMIYAAQFFPTLSDAVSRTNVWLNQALPDYLMTYNEPDNTAANGGSNTSTNDAIALWPQIQALNLPLVSPAPAHYNLDWIANFYTLIASNSYRVDYSAVHIYQPPDAPTLINNLNSVYNAYGRPVWLTEFSPVDFSNTRSWSENTDFNFLAEFMWLAEDNFWLKRYAIFPFSGTPSTNPWDLDGHRGDFFLADGSTLTPYGELYSTWDANRTLQTRTPFLIHNLGTSFRLTSTNVSTPQPSSIRIRDASTQWALLPSPTASQYYVISLKDGRRLRNNGGTPDLAPYGTTGNAVQWWFNGPDSKGYYYVDNLPASQSLRATGTAPAISFSMINDPAPSSATQWRLVKPYAPVTIVTAAPPSVVVNYGSQTVTLTWSGNGLYYNVYRSTVSGGGYVKIGSLVTNLNYHDTTVQNGTAYYYVVTALNILGEESANSNEVVARPASTVPPAINFSLASNGGQNGIQFNWPSDHVGWRLLMNVNGLDSAGFWFPVPNSATTNQLWLPFDPAQSNVFFQLVYP